jgi:hypothetical protein
MEREAERNRMLEGESGRRGETGDLEGLGHSRLPKLWEKCDTA